MRLAMVLLTACGGSAAMAPDAAPLDVSGIDVVAGSQWVLVFPRYTSTSVSEPAQLPDVGACGSFDSDAVLSFPTLLNNVVIDGVPLSNSVGTNQALEGRGITSATTLHANDAGTEIAVPIHAGPYVAATSPRATGSQAGMTVTWQADNADSVFVGTAGGFGLSGCRVAGSEHAYTFAFAPGGEVQIYVEAFAAPETTDTALGPVRVFYGDFAMTTYAP